MIQELLEITKRTNDEVFIKQEELNKGLYLLIDKDGNVIKEEIKEETTEESKAAWENNFKEYHYYSRILNSNKSVIPRSGIQSSNICSFITSQEKFLNKEVCFSIIEKHFESLLELNKEIFEEDYINNCQRLIKKAAEYVHTNIYNYFFKIDKKGEKIYDMGKNKILIFLNLDIDIYKKSFEAYMRDKLFLNSKYNFEKDETIFGVISSNNSLNDKKPFLKEYTRPNKIPSYFSFEDCYAIYKFYNWLLNIYNRNKNGTIKISYRNSSNGLNEAFEGEQEYYLIEGEKVVSLQGMFFVVNRYQFITLESDEIFLKFKNIFEDSNFSMKNIDSWENLYKFIDVEIYHYNLDRQKKNIKVSSTPKNYLSSNMINAYKIFQDSYLDLFKYRDFSCIEHIYDKSLSYFMKGLVDACIADNDNFNLYQAKIKKLFIFKNALNEKFNKGGNNNLKKDLLEIKEDIKNKIIGEDEELSLNNIEEYSYCVGLLARFLANKSKASNKTFDIARDVLHAPNIGKANKSINNLIVKYEHELGLNSKRVHNLIFLTKNVLLDDKTKINFDFLLAGFVDKNPIYTSKEQNDIENEEIIIEEVIKNEEK